MTRTTRRLRQVRAKLTAMRRRLRATDQDQGDDADASDETADSESDALASEIDLDRIPSLLASGEREEMNRAVGWLLTAPSIPRTVATEAVDECLARSGSDALSVKRLAYRGLAAVHSHHPDLVEPHLLTIAAGMNDRYVVVQEACAEVIVDILLRSPRLSPAIYEYLLVEQSTERVVALDILIEVGDTHPVIFEPIEPFLRHELEDPSLPRVQLIEAYLVWEQSNPGVLAHAIPIVVEWFPTTDRDLEETMVRAITAVDEIPEDGVDRVLRSFLTYLATGERPHRAAVSRWIIHAAQSHEELCSTIEAWRDDTSEWERVRVAAAIDEATERGIDVIGDHLLLPWDTYAEQFGMEHPAQDRDP